MSRISQPSSTFGIVASAAATIAAMTVYNVYRARKAEREHPPAGQFVTVDGVRLHYIERGEGPPVVLLHGNVVTAEDFDTSGVLDLIAKRHRVIAFDRPGFGYSDRPHGSACYLADRSLRPMDDIDILVPEDRLADAIAAAYSSF